MNILSELREMKRNADDAHTDLDSKIDGNADGKIVQ